MTRQERANQKATRKFGSDLYGGFLNFIEKHFGKTASVVVNIVIAGVIAYYWIEAYNK